MHPYLQLKIAMLKVTYSWMSWRRYEGLCATSKQRIIAGRKPETKVLYVMQCCPINPLLGGKGQKASRFCASHVQP